MPFTRADFARFVVCVASLAATSSACSDVGSVFHCESQAQCPVGSTCMSGKCVNSSRTADASADDARACMSDDECSTTSSCEEAHCTDGACAHTFKSADFILPDTEQTPGDCQIIGCDGSSAKPVSRADDSDVPSDAGGPCHKHACDNGKLDTGPVTDGQGCNDTGVCKDGECSACMEGQDCTMQNDCTVHQSTCGDDGKHYSCVDTKKPLDGKPCGDNKLCGDGMCNDCVIGAMCTGSTTCSMRTVTSCQPFSCGMNKPTGIPCGTDASGNAMACNAGECSYDCAPGSCPDSDNPCMKTVWLCTEPHAAGACMPKPADDATSCGTDQFCHVGMCQHTALVNGGFTHGLDGWTLTGDGGKFLVAQDPDNYRRWSLSTWVANDPGGGDAATGTVSQKFVVPADAVALRFNVFGGQAVVRLEDASGTKLQQVAGTNSNDVRIPVSWDLTPERGQTVNLVIEDLLTQPNWNFVGVTGFDVIRADAPPLMNSQWDAVVTQGWQLTGDAKYWNIFEDYNYGGSGGVEGVGDMAYGRRRGISSFVRDAAATNAGVAATGTVSQTFVVPPDAEALRFNIYGGAIGRVTLYDGTTDVLHENGANTNAVKRPVSWDLSHYRGKTMKLEAADMGTTGTYDYVGCSGFDLITSYNGP